MHPDLSASKIKNALINSVDKITNLENLCVSGGTLNAYKAVRYVERLLAPRLYSFTENNILSSYQNNVKEYNLGIYSSSLYSLTLTAEVNGTPINYTSGMIKVVDMYGNDINKYGTNSLNKSIISDNNANNVTAFFESGDYSVIIDLNNINPSSLTKLTLTVKSATSINIDIFDDISLNNLNSYIITDGGVGDLIKAVNIKQIGKFTINFKTDDVLSQNAVYYIGKRESTYYNSPIKTLAIGYFSTGKSLTLTLDEGTYYIGYFDNQYANRSRIHVIISRNIVQTNSDALVPDMENMKPVGSEVSVNGKPRGLTTITQGFTRNIFIDPFFAPSTSRLEYIWYSSNPDIATVSQYGTVYACDKYMTQDKEVYIVAIYKNDPTKVFIKKFTILKETETTSIQINVNMKMSPNSLEYIDLSNVDVSINMLQYYHWSSSSSVITVSQWGQVYVYPTVQPETTAVITGVYNINPRVVIKVNVIIE